jgi:hypothetical protein
VAYTTQLVLGKCEICRLKSGQAQALVEAAATRAAGQERRRFVLKLEPAEGTTKDMPKCRLFASLPPPLVEGPSAENRPEHNAEVNDNEVTEADGDHGVIPFGL